MRTCTIHGFTAPLLDLNIAPFLQDSRVSDVEHTLELLIKSRHGNDASVRKLGRYVTSRINVIRENCVDLHPKRVVIPFVRKAFRSVIDAVRNGVRNAFQIIRDRIAMSTNIFVTATNLARGSPSQTFRTETNPGNQKHDP